MSADTCEMVRVNWENQSSALLSLMDTLFRTQTLVDCTLSGTESTYKVHKVLLSSCSPYFQKIIVDSPPDSHPVFVLDASDDDLQALVQYLYQGYTDIPKDNVKRFLKVAMPVHCQNLPDSTTSSTKPKPNNKTNQLKRVNKESVKVPSKGSTTKENGNNENKRSNEKRSKSINDSISNDDNYNISINNDVGTKKKMKVKRAPCKKRKLQSQQSTVIPQKSDLSLFEQSALDFFQPALDSLQQNVEQPIVDSFMDDSDRLIEEMKPLSESKVRLNLPNDSDIQTRIHPDLMKTVEKSMDYKDMDQNIVSMEEPSTSGDEPSGNPLKPDDDDVVIVEKKNEVFVIDDDEDSQDEGLGAMDEMGAKEDSGKLSEEMVTEEESTPPKSNLSESNKSGKVFSKKQKKRSPNNEALISDLDTFIQVLPDGRYRCMFCSFIRPTMATIKAHIIKNHYDSKSKVSIPPKVNLIKAFVCRQCNERFHTHERYREHTALKHGEKPVHDFNLKCSYCGIHLENLTQYRKHAREVHNKNTQIVSLFCGLCGEKTNNSPFHTKTVCALMRAGKMPHKVIIKSDADLKSAIMCDKCLRVFKSWSPFKEHFMRGCGGP